MTAPGPPREPVKCDRPACANWFIPAHKNHRFCSTTCKRRVQAYRFVLRPGTQR